MEEYNILRMQNRLKEYLTRDRFIHTQGVMYTATALAMCHGEDLVRAQVAGLLHDSAKCIPNKKKLKICAEHHIPVSDFEKEHPILLQAKLGAYIAKAKYNVTDKEILSAITYHTTGKPDMTMLEKIVYIADYIEPARNKAPRLTEIRRLAFEDLDECMYQILKDTLSYLDENPNDVDSATKDAYAYYTMLHEDRLKIRKQA